MDLRRFSSTTELEVSGRREKQWGSQHPLIKMQQTKSGRAGFLSLLRQKLFVYLQRKTNIFDVMAKKKNKNQLHQIPKKFVEGDYNQEFLNFLGKDVLRDFLADNNLAIAEAQKFSSEVREKSLQTIGLLATFALAIFVALYSIQDLTIIASVTMVAILCILAIGMYIIFNEIIKEKKNHFAGNSLRYLLPQTTIDRLANTIDEKEKMCQHLYLMLKDKEEVLDAATAEVEKMQKHYKRATSFMLQYAAILLTLSLLASVCFRLAGAAYALADVTLVDVLRLFL